MIFIARYATELGPFFFYLMCVWILVVKGATNVRLAGSMIPLEGRVEVYYKGEWGTVCRNGWNAASKNLEVVCRELGFMTGRSVSSQYPGIGTTWLDGVVCKGDEKSVVDCPHKPWGDTSCRHSEDVSVQCDVCSKPIISSSENLVKDWSFSATAYRETDPPYHARLRSTGAWCLPELRNMAFRHYLEIDLPRLYLVSAVASLGGVTAANYVKSYKILYSINEKDWYTASVDGNEVIPGNSASGNENAETRQLDSTIRAKFLRFIPVTWASVACMRVEICGHQLPHSPTVLIKVKASSIVISWSQPDSGDEAITKYYVRYWKTDEGKSSHKTLESTATSAVIVSSLSPYTEYRLEVSGVSNLGEGLPNEYMFRTLESVPSGSPTQIKATLLGTAAVNITWSPPDKDKRNGQITGYIVCFPHVESNMKGNCQDPIVVPGSQTWYSLVDNDFSIEHSVQIRAKTAVGAGPIGTGTTGIWEYSSPDDVASSLIIAVTFGTLLLVLIAVVILAAKGVILKNFVNALRKLTSSQMTVSTHSSTKGDQKKQKIPYDEPEEPSQRNQETTRESLYDTSRVEKSESIRDTTDNVRRMTLALVKESDIYSDSNGLKEDYAKFRSPGEPLYESKDIIVPNLLDPIITLQQVASLYTLHNVPTVDNTQIKNSTHVLNNAQLVDDTQVADNPQGQIANVRKMSTPPSHMILKLGNEGVVESSLDEHLNNVRSSKLEDNEQKIEVSHYESCDVDDSSRQNDKDSIIVSLFESNDQEYELDSTQVVRSSRDQGAESGIDQDLSTSLSQSHLNDDDIVEDTPEREIDSISISFPGEYDQENDPDNECGDATAHELGVSGTGNLLTPPDQGYDDENTSTSGAADHELPYTYTHDAHNTADQEHHSHTSLQNPYYREELDDNIPQDNTMSMPFSRQEIHDQDGVYNDVCESRDTDSNVVDVGLQEPDEYFSDNGAHSPEYQSDDDQDVYNSLDEESLLQEDGFLSSPHDHLGGSQRVSFPRPVSPRLPK